jgi:long-chain acyl-CoA synthetase
MSGSFESDQDGGVPGGQAHSSAHRSIQDARMFMRLLSRMWVREDKVFVRNYGQGVWQQFSGRDIVAHLGRSAAGWQDFLNTRRQRGGASEDLIKGGEPDGSTGERRGQRACLMCVGTQSYASWITSYGALLAGADVFFAPEQLNEAELIETCRQFAVDAIVCEPHQLLPRYQKLGLPVFHTVQSTWAAQDDSEPPEAVLGYTRLEQARRQKRFGGDFQTGRGRWASKAVSNGDDSGVTGATAFARDLKSDRLAQDSENELEPGPTTGDLLFVSIGNDGYHKKVRLSFNAFMIAAQNFLLHVDVPASVQWRTIELIPLAHPLAHTSRLAVLLKNGVLGFMNPDAEWESNLSILQPSCLFVGPAELALVADHVTEVRRLGVHRSRVALSEGLSKARDYLQGARSLKLPPVLYAGASLALRAASRQIVGSGFTREATGNLRFIVHGLAAAQRLPVRVMDRVGVPVIETYGKTAACGLLSSNTFAQPHFNLIGSPLPHVSFRLAGESLLEYRLSSEYFDDAGAWISSGDIAQMTPYGFSIVGRKEHQLRTRGGVVIFPGRFERRLTDTNIIEQACIVGDNMPFLSALVVLSPEARAAFTRDPDRIRADITEVIGAVNETLPRNGTLKKFEILDEPFLESRGEVLPNGGINRVRILETRRLVIQKIYGNEADGVSLVREKL